MMARYVRWLFALTLAAAGAEESTTLRMSVRDDGRNASDGLVVGDEARLVIHDGTRDGSPVCVAVNGADEACVPARPDGGIDDLVLAGFAPGTHVLAARLGRRRAEAVVDFLPGRHENAAGEPENYVPDPRALPPASGPRRRICIFANSLERHSQNEIFARASAALAGDRWAFEWFVPWDRAPDDEVLLAALAGAGAAVRATDLSRVDYAALRRGRLAGDPGVAADARASLDDESAAALAGRCDLFWYANTRDDAAVAGLAEVAAALAPSAPKVMELPNLDPPPDGAVDAYVAPSAFAATHASVVGAAGHRPVAVIWPAALDGAAPPRRGGADGGRGGFVVASVGRLSPERSPGLFVRAVARLRRDPLLRAVRRFPGEEGGDARPHFRALVLGDGPLREPLERLSLEVGANVEFRGAVSRAEVATTLAGVDVLLSPRAAGETFGVANAEAAAAGATVVAYARSGANESAGANAVCLDSLDPAAYAAATRDVLLDAGYRAASAAAASDAAEAFSAAAFADAYDRYFSSLLAPSEGEATLLVAYTDASAYAAGLVGLALSGTFDRVEMARLEDAARVDVLLAGCLEGGCRDAWDGACAAAADARVREAAAKGSRGALLLCGEAWDLRPAAASFDAVLSTTRQATGAALDVHLPTAATAFGELRRPLADLAEPARGPPPASRAGAAYLYYRCRPHREAIAGALRRSGVRVDALGRCGGGGEAADRSEFVDRRFAAEWHDAAATLYADYKFVVAFENDDAPGYVTEKLSLALLAGAVPVYWGPFDSAFAVFNRNALIACDTTLDACAAAVRAADVNATRYAELRDAAPLAPGGRAILAAEGLAADLAPLRALLRARRS